MLRRTRLVVLAGLGWLLAACATPTPYAPRATETGYGYSETRIEANRVKLSFRGNSLTDRETVETYLLFRAAELTLAAGLDHFVLTARATDANRRVISTGGRFSAGFGFDHWYYSPRWGWRFAYDPFFDDPISLREVTRFEASGEVVMLAGPKPADNPNAFDARDVQQTLAGRIRRPEPAAG